MEGHKCRQDRQVEVNACAHFFRDQVLAGTTVSENAHRVARRFTFSQCGAGIAAVRSVNSGPEPCIGKAGLPRFNG